MKRDWDLIRDILEAIENETIVSYEKKAGNNEKWKDSLKDADEIQQIREQRLKRIHGHIRLLIDGGYISHVNSHITSYNDILVSSGISTMPTPVYHYEIDKLELSMAGHDMLEHMRTPKVWNKAKEIAEKAGVELTLDFLKTVFPLIPKLLISSAS